MKSYEILWILMKEVIIYTARARISALTFLKNKYIRSSSEAAVRSMMATTLEGQFIASFFLLVWTLKLNLYFSSFLKRTHYKFVIFCAKTNVS